MQREEFFIRYLTRLAAMEFDGDNWQRGKLAKRLWEARKTARAVDVPVSVVSGEYMAHKSHPNLWWVRHQSASGYGLHKFATRQEAQNYADGIRERYGWDVSEPYIMQVAPCVW